MTSRPEPMAQRMYDSNALPSPFIDEIVQLVRYRSLVTELIARDIKTRYKRSVLGVAWTLLHPLATMLVMAFVFQSLFQRSIERYAVYLLSALLVWQYFTTTTTHGANQLVWGGALLHRIYLPKAVFAVSAAGTGLVNLLLSLVPLGIVMVLTGTPLRPAILALPLAVLLLAAFSLGVGLLLSALAVHFVDVLNMFSIVLTMWMYLTPILYPADMLPAAYQWVLRVNPMTYLLEVFRSPIHAGVGAPLASWVTAALVAVGALVVGWWVFTRQSDEYAYRV
ncbi:MAG: ABC transporter permease [Anaerolineales bacterium]